MEEKTYEKVTTENDQKVEPTTETYSCKVNECYQLQSFRSQKTNSNAEDHESYKFGNGGAGENTLHQKSDSQLLRIKKCLIALTFTLLTLSLVTIVALVLTVIYYHQSSRELTNKVKFFNHRLHQITQEFETTLLNKDSTISDYHDQLKNDTYGVKNELSSLQVQIYCGAGQWNRVAFLNMSDPSQQCPSAWRLVTTSGVRACGRTESSVSSCPGAFFPTVNEYNRVCGKVIGYQDHSPDGFHRTVTSNNGINGAYLDGVSITYGETRNHVWSYVAGLTEISSSRNANNCPCSTQAGTGPPSFVGDNYYCESGNPTDTWGPFQSADKLWDGKQCEGTCCSGSKSPPWFSVHLPNPTTESIEVRICGDQSTYDEDTPIELLEIYVQ